MSFGVKILIIFWIFIQKSITADSSYSQLTDLGRSTFSHNLSSYQFNNCSSYTIAYGSTCTCFECSEDRCTICCNSPGFRCCYCHACLSSCWKNNWQLLSLAQVGLSTALLIATIATIALFFRICNSGFNIALQSNRDGDGPFDRESMSRISVSSMQQYIINRLRNRPPRYNDSLDAPPLYDTDPTNRPVSTPEPPPRYTRRAEPTSDSANNEMQQTANVQLPTSAHHI